MPGRTDRRLRMVALLVAFAIFASAAIVRLSYWQVVAAPGLVATIVRDRTSDEPDLIRGAIVDRDGHMLAQTATYDQLVAYPRDVPEERRAEIVATLAEILELDATRQQVYLDRLSRDVAWDRLEPRLTPQQSIDIQLAKDDGLLPSIGLEPVAERVYPRKGGQGGTTLASHLLGFVAGDSGGAAGVERLYDDRLSGREASPAVASIAGAGSAVTSGSLADPTLDGIVVPPLQLTIDAGLQRDVERILTHVRVLDKAKSVSAILMDPYTGAIYASASVPAYDANEFAEVFEDDPSALRDRVVSDVYEPGSVMKMFTVAAALSAGVVTPMTPISDQVKLDFGPDVEPVQNSDRRSIGRRPVRTMIAESRNVATAKIAQRMGRTQKASRLLYETWKRLGVAGRTGVDLAGEEAGIARDPASDVWHPVDLANASFGQGVATTLVQLATGYAAFMNGGTRVQPHVVMDGDASRVPPERVLKPKVARQTQDILEWVTGSVYRYAKGALIRGYAIGGKTGTAQIWDARKGAFKEKRFNHTFVGYVGSDRPEVLIALRIEEPVPLDLKPLDLEVESYEAFRLVAGAAIKHLDIRKARDPDAGWPIRGTEAARKLTPDRAKPDRSDRRGSRRDRPRRDRAARPATPRPSAGVAAASARAAGA